MTTALTDMKCSLDFASFCKEHRKPTKEPCKGLFYRVLINSFRDSNGVIHSNTSFRPLLRKSCKGCDKCSYMMDDAQERNWQIDYSTSLCHNDLVELKVTNISHDWESGYIDDWDLEFVKVKEEK